MSKVLSFQDFLSVLNEIDGQLRQYSRQKQVEIVQQEQQKREVRRLFQQKTEENNELVRQKQVEAAQQDRLRRLLRQKIEENNELVRQYRELKQQQQAGIPINIGVEQDCRNAARLLQEQIEVLSRELSAANSKVEQGAQNLAAANRKSAQGAKALARLKQKYIVRKRVCTRINDERKKTMKQLLIAEDQLAVETDKYNALLQAPKEETMPLYDDTLDGLREEVKRSAKEIEKLKEEINTCNTQGLLLKEAEDKVKLETEQVKLDLEQAVVKYENELDKYRSKANDGTANSKRSAIIQDLIDTDKEIAKTKEMLANQDALLEPLTQSSVRSRAVNISFPKLSDTSSTLTRSLPQLSDTDRVLTRSLPQLSDTNRALTRSLPQLNASETPLTRRAVDVSRRIPAVDTEGDQMMMQLMSPSNTGGKRDRSPISPTSSKLLAADYDEGFSDVPEITDLDMIDDEDKRFAAYVNQLRTTQKDEWVGVRRPKERLKNLLYQELDSLFDKNIPGVKDALLYAIKSLDESYQEPKRYTAAKLLDVLVDKIESSA